MEPVDLCLQLDNFVRIAEDIKELGIHIAYTISWSDSTRTITSYPYEDDVSRLLSYVRSTYTLEDLKDNKVIRAYRDFFWRLGIDPTKTRPASEALVRRALKGQFPRIHLVVDAGNIASTYTLIPIGMYDIDKVAPPLTIRYSYGGEIFRPIGGRKEEVLPKGIPILVDSSGTVMHIYPHRDSIETCVTDKTLRIITIAAGVPGAEKNLVVKAVSIVIELLQKIGWNSCEKIVYKV